MSSDQPTAIDGSRASPADATVEDRLLALERASDERRVELQRLAAELPAAVSRRSLLVGAARGLKGAPNKADIARRGVRKFARLPGALVRRARH